jgi:hypothetical protein
VFGRLGHVEVLAHPETDVAVDAAFALVEAIGLDTGALMDAVVARVGDVDPFSLGRYLVGRTPGSMSGSNAYTLRDAVGGATVLEGREPALGADVDIKRLLGRGRVLTRFKVVLRGVDGATALTLRRGFARPIAMVEVLDAQGMLVGRIKPRWWSMLPTHDLLDRDDRRLARLKIAVLGGGASVDRDGVELARFTRASGGLLSAGDGWDELAIVAALAPDDPLRKLLVATAIYLDLRTKD